MGIKNLAAVLTKQKKFLSLFNLKIDEIPKGYVIVKMEYSGICHTQLNEINGILGKDKFIPHCMGHEGVGKIVKKGTGVKNFKIGDRVVVSWIKKKTKTNYKSIKYYYNNKTINSGGCNTLLQYSLVSDNRIYKLSLKNKYFKESILLGCALPTATSAILKISKIYKNSKVLIMGMGGLGYSCLFALNYLNCKNIVCIDNNSKKLNLMNKSRHINFMKINKKNIGNFLNKNHEKFDVIIDCTGSKSLIEQTFSLCKKFRGKFIIIGNSKLGVKISLNIWDLIYSKSITGAWGEEGTIMQNFNLIEKILVHQIKNIRKVLKNKIYSIHQVNQAIQDFQKGKILRPIIKF